jgi:hypothetical protein
MGWNGDGEQLRNCSEEQLATLCPYQAIVTGIDSLNHQPGAFVPIPARDMIGKVIARFVTEKKSREVQATDVQRRLYEERSRLHLAMGSFPVPEYMHAQAIPLSRTESSASRRSMRAQTMLPPVAPDGQATSSLGAVMWMEPTAAVNGRNVPNSRMLPGQTVSRPYMSEALGDASCVQLPSSHGSSVTPIAPHDTTSSVFSHFAQQSHTPEQHPISHRPSVHISEGLSTDFGHLNITDTGTHSSGLPQSYAPRHPSGLLASSTTGKNDINTLCGTVPVRRSQTIRAVDASVRTVPSKRSLGFFRRRTSSTTSKLNFDAISESISEEGEDSGPSEDAQKRLRHDSGIEDNPYENESFSKSSSALVEPTTSNSTEDMPPVLVLPRAASTSPDTHHAWSAPHGHNTLPVSKQMAHSVAFDLRHNAATVSSLSSDSGNPDCPTKDDSPVKNKDRGDSSEATRLAKKFQAIEFEYHKLKQMRDEALEPLSTATPQPSLRKAQSDRTLYSSLNPIQGIPTGHKPWQYKAAFPHALHRSDLRPQSPDMFRPPQRTLIDVIEDKERRAMRSSKMQELQRKKHVDAMSRYHRDWLV